LEEGHPTATGPEPGSLTDGRQPCRLAALDRRLYVRHLDSDVVQAGAAPF
jgi:hypothetical protein